jgi:hypothetical protein
MMMMMLGFSKAKQRLCFGFFSPKKAKQSKVKMPKIESKAKQSKNSKK